MTHHNEQRTTADYTRLTSQVGRQANDKESTTFYMETEHEISNILTSGNRTTTKMQVV